MGTLNLFVDVRVGQPDPLYGAIFGLVGLKLLLGTVLLAGRRRPAP